jgi:HK97 gp10 family phage protein
VADTQTLHGVDDLLRKLKALPPEIVSKRGGPVKSALRKGAKVIHKQAVENIEALAAASSYENTGVLADALTVSRDPKPQQSGANERYRVHLRRRKHPNGVTAVAAGRYLEFGTEKRPPTPWLAPAFFAKRQEALERVLDELSKGIDRIVKKLSRGH